MKATRYGAKDLKTLTRIKAAVAGRGRRSRRPLTRRERRLLARYPALARKVRAAHSGKIRPRRKP